MTSTHLLRTILWAGLLLRLLLPLILGPFNNDDHVDVIEFILEQGRVPHSDELNQAFHPPLYYVIGSLALEIAGPAGLRGVSVAASCITLWLLYSLLGHRFEGATSVRALLLALFAFHPPLVMHGSFVSNDPLAVMLGAGTFWFLERYVRRATTRDALCLGIVLGLGLLTKATFLAFIAPLAGVALYLRRDSPRRIGLDLAALLVPAVLLGAYKYVDNWVVLGNPFFSNLDLALPWVAQQQPTFRGLPSLIDINVWKLVREPTVSPGTVHSYPLMLYGSLWYQYIPESTFRGNVGGLRHLGSLIYVVALIPTCVALAGAGALVRRFFADRRRDIVFELASLAILVSNLALVVTAGLHYDVWSVFQARLLFPSLFALIVCLAVGLRLIERHSRIAFVVRVVCWVLVALFLLYFAAEIVQARMHPIDPDTRFHMTYRVPMDVS